MLVDTHCHLMESHFEADLASVLERSALAGVGKLLNLGCDVAGSRRSAKMCASGGVGGSHAVQIFGSQGVHPHDADQMNEAVIEEFRATIAANPMIRVVGETGLDYFYMRQPREVQLAGLRMHMRLAEEVGLPVSIHCREASDGPAGDAAGVSSSLVGVRDALSARRDIITVLREFPRVRCVMHCFAQDREYAEEVLAMPAGNIISFSGTVTYPRAEDVRAVAVAAPVDRIVVETDAPYLAPQTCRGRRNEPAFVVETAKFIADLRGMSFDEFATVTTRNAERFFGI